MGHAWSRDSGYPKAAPESEHPVPAAVREQPAYQQVMARLRAKVYASLAAEQRPAAADGDERESAA